MVSSIPKRGSPSLASTFTRLLSVSEDRPSWSTHPRSPPALHTASAPSKRATAEQRPRADEQLLLRRGEKLVAPVKRVGNRLVARRDVGAAAGWNAQPPLQARQHGVGRNCPCMAGRQFDGEWQPVSCGADPCHGRRFGGGQREIAVRRGGAGDEQGDGSILEEYGQRGEVRGVRDRQRRHCKTMLTIEMKHLAASHEQLQVPARVQQRREQRGRGHEMLEVVHHEQCGFMYGPPHVIFQCVHERAGIGVSESKDLREDGRHRGGVADAGKIDERHTPRKWSASCDAACTANRVFPLPPTPVSVTSLTSSRLSNPPSARSSCFRPISDVRGAGRGNAAGAALHPGASGVSVSSKRLARGRTGGAT